MGRGMPGLPRSILHCAVSPAGACDRGIHQVNPAAERRSLSVLAGGAVQPLAFGGEFHREQQRQHRYALPSKETAPVQPLLSPGRAGSRRFWRGFSVTPPDGIYIYLLFPGLIVSLEKELTPLFEELRQVVEVS